MKMATISLMERFEAYKRREQELIKYKNVEERKLQEILGEKWLCSLSFCFNDYPIVDFWQPSIDLKFEPRTALRMQIRENSSPIIYWGAYPSSGDELHDVVCFWLGRSKELQEKTQKALNITK